MVAYGVSLGFAGLSMWIAVLSLGMALAFFVHPLDIATLITIFLSSGISGALFGLLNWFLLTGKFIHARPWVIVNSIGWAVGISLMFFVAEQVGQTAGIILLGVVIGAMQWLVLRREFSHAFVWIIANAVSWSVGIALFFVNDGVIIGGTIMCIITGLTYVWLLRHPIKQIDSSTSSMTSV
jgi:hypothetical protein